MTLRVEIEVTMQKLMIIDRSFAVDSVNLCFHSNQDVEALEGPLILSLQTPTPDAQRPIFVVIC